MSTTKRRAGQMQGENEGRNARRAAEERHISGAINSLHRDYNVAQKARGEEAKRSFKWTRWTVITAIVGSVVTTGLFVTAIVAINQTRQALDEAKRAADAATQQAEVAEDAEIRQLRPYLRVAVGDTSWTVNPDGTVKIGHKPKIKVIGQTPAGNVAAAWKLKVDLFPISKTFEFHVPGPEVTATAAAFPDDPVNIESQELVISKEDIEMIEKGTKRIYAEGMVYYIDSFAAKGKARWSQFCFYADMKFASNGWFACPVHNDADWNPHAPTSAVAPMQ